MRNLLRFILSFSLCLPALLPAMAQTEVTDTILFGFSFRQGESALDLSYRDNGRQMTRLIDSIGSIAHREGSEIVAVNVEGSASPEGSAAGNVALALRRAKDIRSRLLKASHLDGDLVKAYSLGVDRARLVELVLKSDYPRRDTIAAIIARTHNQPADKAFARLRKLDGGAAWQWLMREVFPEMRLATASVVCYVRSIRADVPATDAVERVVVLRDTVYQRDTVYIAAEAAPAAAIAEEDTLPYRRKMVVALRSNLLLPLLNVGVEVPIGNRWSVGADWYYPWLWRNWHKSTEMKNCFELLMGGADVHYWLGSRHAEGEDNWKYRLSGHAVGVYGYYGYYDIGHDYKGHQGDFYNVGVDYVFSTRIGRTRLWRLEFTLGVGYIHSGATKYRVYTDGGHAFRTGINKNFNWFGPTKVGISLVIPLYKKIRKEVPEL